MARVVATVAPEFDDLLSWEKVITKELAGARRYQEFSKLCGKPVPVPSIAINGKLVFETTPGPEELRNRIHQTLSELGFS
ncbi:hypothetical protein D1AOALGA4SA_13185 [Olavius algarvensis Delta 1 endosymbiont]|nr:hypothetical protein D1AOALGA4SA_13185 [Olavius algarvensis Delta 1 endosymbiont]